MCGQGVLGRVVLAGAMVLAGGCGSATPVVEPEPDVQSDVTVDIAPDTATEETGSGDAAGDTMDAADSTGADTDVGPDLTWAERFAEVIPPTGVVELHIAFAPGDWVKLLAAWTDNIQKTEFPATIQYGKYAQPGAGVRLKGLSSLVIGQGQTADPKGKYPLKLDFNAFGGERLLGVDEVALNSGVHDPSHMREWLTAAMYQGMSVDVAHLGFANGFVDDVWVGLYTLSQSVDKTFLKERFGTAGGLDNGNLYKCVHNGFGACSLAWLGDQKSDYAHTEGCDPGYDACGLVLQTNEDDPAQNDYKDILALIHALNDTAEADLPTELPKVFDVEHFLRLAAVAAATDNYDSYFGKGNNFYLYHRKDGRFQMIPWDFDGTYGGGCEADLADPTCGGLQSHPLAGRILAIPQWRATYLQHLCTIAKQWMTVPVHKAWITALDARIGQLARTEPHPSQQGSYDLQTATDPPVDDFGNLLGYVAKREKFLSGACGAK